MRPRQLTLSGGGAGTITGPVSSTDNAITRWDGTGGATIQDSPVIIEDTGEMYGYLAKINDQTGTTYTLQASDTGKIVVCNNASPITVTLPNSLSVGFICEVVQKGAGKITFSAASGATLNNFFSHTKTAGQKSVVNLRVTDNSGGAAASYYLSGITGA